MIFKRFDYEHPPASGLYWIDFSIPEASVFTDHDDLVMIIYTRRMIRKLGLVFIYNSKTDDLPFLAWPVEMALCDFENEMPIIHSFSPALIPDLPEDCTTNSGWIEHTGGQDAPHVDKSTWFWLAKTIVDEGDEDGECLESVGDVILAQRKVRDGKTVPGFVPPEHVWDSSFELFPDDPITHYMPLEIPTLPVIVEPEMLATKDELIRDAMRLGGSVVELYAVSTGQIPHIYQGMCPDAVEGASSRDDECPACKILMKADEALAASGLANPGVHATPVATDQPLPH